MNCYRKSKFTLRHVSFAISICVVFFGTFCKVTLEFCLKNRFLPLSSKLSIFRKKRTLFWDHLEKRDFCQKKNRFLPLSSKLSIFRGKGRVIFANKIVFWLYLLNYTYFEEKDVILRSPWKNWFLSIESFFGCIF